MQLFKKHWEFIFLIFFSAFLFWATTFPAFSNTDIWFHIKSGEIISKFGIIHHDVFAYTTVGREWFPNEWLFQVAVYQWQRFFGFEAIDYFIAFGLTLTILGIYKILRNILSLNVLLSAYLTIFYLFVNFFIFQPRPYAYAYGLLIWTIFLILLYVLKNKNYLFLSIPLTLIWTNIHGSVIFSVYLFIAYATVYFILYLFKRDKTHLKSARMLGAYGLVSFIITILPPLWTTQYRLLLLFWENKTILSKVFIEWAPIYKYHYDFYIFLMASFISLGGLLVSIIKSRNKLNAIWFLPLFLFIALPIINYRHFPIAFITLVIILGYLLQKLSFKKLPLIPKTVLVVILSLVLSLSAISFWQSRNYIYLIKQDNYNNFPIGGVKYIKDYKLQGHMFNMYPFGGYILYHLYPQQKVFIDGRDDLYFCCEIPLYVSLYQKKLPSNQFKKQLDDVWNKYDISFVLINTIKETYLRQMSDVLMNDPKWMQVYWDDKSQIFVKKDGKNDLILGKYGALAATPYAQEPYKKGQQKLALDEYKRMISVIDSARSRNGIGFILAQEGNFGGAKKQFLKAIELDSTLSWSYQNVAEIYINEKDFDSAVKMYETDLKVAPDDSLPYLRLGQLYLNIYNDKEKARTIWQKGIDMNFNKDTILLFKDLINKTY